MVITLQWSGQQYTANLAEPIDISIALQRDIDRQPNAFGAPPYEATPHKAGDFVGALTAGSPVNFFNVRVNPHGNGTHTECVGHILEGDYTIVKTLQKTLVVAELITVYPTRLHNGDMQITREVLSALSHEQAEALVIRTMPNGPEKAQRKYTGTNPPYFSVEAMEWIHQQGVLHLLTDLPSVDPENDGGALNAHKIFWQTDEKPRTDRTITEMVFVDNTVEDGLYLLDIQTAPLALDVSPSRPVLYKMRP